MECHPMFSSVYISLILMTAGFVLTLCSWLAPPLNEVVGTVRIAGLASLFIGSVFLSLACIVGSFNQGKCFPFCYACENKRQPKGSFLAQSIENPFLTTAILGSTLCTEDPGDPCNPEQSSTSGNVAGQSFSYSFEDKDSNGIVIENKGACAKRAKSTTTKAKRKRDYQSVPVTDELDVDASSPRKRKDPSDVIHTEMDCLQISSFQLSRERDSPPEYLLVTGQSLDAPKDRGLSGETTQVPVIPLPPKTGLFKCDNLNTEPVSDSHSSANIARTSSTSFPLLQNNNRSSDNTIRDSRKELVKNTRKTGRDHCRSGLKTSAHQPDFSSPTHARTEPGCYSNTSPTYGGTNSVQIKIYEKMDTASGNRSNLQSAPYINNK